MTLEPTITRRRLRRRQWLAASAIVGPSLLAAILGWWPYNMTPPTLTADKAPTLAQFFLQDRLTLGFVRLGVVLLAMFVITSIPALIVAGRWIRSFGTGGLPVDEVAADEAIAELNRQLQEALKQRDEAREYVREALGGGGPRSVD